MNTENATPPEWRPCGLTPPFRALRYRESHRNAYNDYLTLNAVLVAKLDDKRRRAYIIHRGGDRFYRAWIPQSELLLQPGDFNNVFKVAAARLLLRAPAPVLGVEDAEEYAALLARLKGEKQTEETKL